MVGQILLADESCESSRDGSPHVNKSFRGSQTGPESLAGIPPSPKLSVSFVNGLAAYSYRFWVDVGASVL